jgi:hypothetical protein
MTPVSWPEAVLGHDVAGVGDAGFFDDGEGVHVGADEERGAGAVLEDADDSEGLTAVGVFADVLGDGVAGLARALARMAEVRSSWCESSGWAWRSL